MSRIEAPRRLGPFGQVSKVMSKRLYGRVPEPFFVTAHHPGILRGYGMFEWETERAHAVDEKLKDLAMIKVAALVGCEWCLDIGSAIGRKAGITKDQLADLPRYRESDLFDETEKLVLDYATAMTETPSDVPEDLFDALRARFDERQLVELTSAIAIENYRARFNWAVRIAPQGFTRSGACAIPERPAEAVKASAG
jgi:AhpD family alkylhydroperoxidase